MSAFAALGKVSLMQQPFPPAQRLLPGTSPSLPSATKPGCSPGGGERRWDAWHWGEGVCRGTLRTPRGGPDPRRLPLRGAGGHTTPPPSRPRTHSMETRNWTVSSGCGTPGRTASMKKLGRKIRSCGPPSWNSGYLRGDDAAN